MGTVDLTPEPMAMRSRRLARCSTCGLNAALCVCASLRRLAPRTRVIVIAHRTELFKSTNTAKLAVRMLEGAELVCRADPERSPPSPPERGAWVLYPSDDAVPLHEAMARGLTQLVVPDGTWNQAKRIARRNPWCAALPRVRLDVTRESSYRLRRNARPDGLCTLEAIAEALRVLEGDALADAMRGVLDTWVARSELVRKGAHDMRGALDDVPDQG